MTKEQAKFLYSIADSMGTTGIEDFTCKDGEKMREIIKALEQQKPLETFENTKDHICKLANDYKCWDNRLSHEESLELYNILEQPTSDDCVSRQAVLDLAVDYGTNSATFLIPVSSVKNLPPVTPTRKSGLRWVERFDNEDKWLECPHCHKDSDNAYAYCPNCGASFKEEKRGDSYGSN